MKKVQIGKKYHFLSIGLTTEVEVSEIIDKETCKAKFTKIIDGENIASKSIVEEVRKMISDGFTGNIRISQLKKQKTS